VGKELGGNEELVPMMFLLKKRVLIDELWRGRKRGNNLEVGMDFRKAFDFTPTIVESICVPVSLITLVTLLSSTTASTPPSSSSSTHNHNFNPLSIYSQLSTLHHLPSPIILLLPNPKPLQSFSLLSTNNISSAHSHPLNPTIYTKHPRPTSTTFPQKHTLNRFFHK